MRYGNQRVEDGRSRGRSRRIENVRDVMALMRVFHERYGERYGEGSQATESGVRIDTVRVSTFVEIGKVDFRDIQPSCRSGTPRSRRASVHATSSDTTDAITTPTFDETRAVARDEHRRAGRRHDGGDDVPRRAGMEFPREQLRRRVVRRITRNRGNDNDVDHGQQRPDLSAEEQALLDQFLNDHTLFYGPDPGHRAEPRPHAALRRRGARAVRGRPDVNRINLVRGRIESALEEGFTMVEKMGVAPGAKWGDLVTAVFTASGDMAQIAPSGIGVFASVCQYPIKFINKYWTHEPTVGVRDGDAFIHNDSRYGNVHNTDQSLIMPLFHRGELVCWLATIIHEGENGSIEPGGLPSISESKFDEGLKMSPFRCAENFELKRDIVTFLQNSVREPKLQYADMKVKLHACIRLRERLITIIEEFGKDYLTATLRRTLEDTEDGDPAPHRRDPGRHDADQFLDRLEPA